jgi:hypothetical protein
MKKAISAQKTRMFLEDTDAPAVGTGKLLSGSKSQPCVVKFDDITKVRNGRAVLVIGTGFASLDGQSWIVQNIDLQAKTAELAGSDTSGESATWSTQAAWIEHVYIDVCVKSYQLNETAAAQIDTTTLCDDEKTFLVGFSDPGTLTFDFFFDPTDPDYQTLVEAKKKGDERFFEIHYRNGAIRTLPVIVQAVNEAGGVDQAIQGSATIKVTDAPVLTMPPWIATPNYLLVPIFSEPTTGAAPFSATLALNESGGSATSFEIDWQDGTPAETVTSAQATHSYQNVGTYQPMVKATIGGSQTAPFRCQNSAQATEPPPPPYALTADVQPTSGVVPAAVTLTLTETNGTADYFDADWGDGSAVERVTGLTAPHTYAAAGTFTTTVTPTLAGVAGTAVSAAAVTVA